MRINGGAEFGIKSVMYIVDINLKVVNLWQACDIPLGDIK